jgi:hypothetical protein
MSNLKRLYQIGLTIALHPVKRSVDAQTCIGVLVIRIGERTNVKPKLSDF